MGRTLFAIFLCVTLLSCNARTQEPTTIEPPKCDIKEPFATEVRQILKETKSQWTSYPDPPDLTCEAWNGLYQELKSGPNRGHFDTLTANLASEHQSAIEHFKSQRQHFSLLAIAVHSTPDTRVNAVHALYELATLKLLINTSAEGARLHKKMEKKIARFLLHILTQTPWGISGSENATIHSVYMSKIAQTLDFILLGKLADPKQSHSYDIDEKKMETWNAALSN